MKPSEKAAGTLEEIRAQIREHNSRQTSLGNCLICIEEINRAIRERDEMRAALEKISANAAEAPEWIRRVAQEALEGGKAARVNPNPFRQTGSTVIEADDPRGAEYGAILARFDDSGTVTVFHSQDGYKARFDNEAEFGVWVSAVLGGGK